MYSVRLSKQAVKDFELLKQNGLASKASVLLRIIRANPYENPPPYEKLKGLASAYSRRINVQHRLVYEVLPMPGENDERDENDNLYEGRVKVLRMWTHYDL